MKNLIIYSGIALVVLTNIDKKAVGFINGREASQESKKEIVTNNSVKVITRTAVLSNFTKEVKNSGYSKKTNSFRNFSKLESYKTSFASEPIELFSVQKNIKTADQLIAEDNAITGNSISNETLALDYFVINSNNEESVFVESVNIPKKERTADQLIAEDNAITGNNISNEALILDFDQINIISEGYVFVESIYFPKKERTADQLIAEDNAITGNNISNETQVLDFDVINKCSKS